MACSGLSNMGLQFRAEELGALLEGRTPGFGAEPSA